MIGALIGFFINPNLFGYSKVTPTTQTTNQITTPTPANNETVTPQPVVPTIKTCADGTPYGECSSSPPQFCNNGLLITKASRCGCPPSYHIDGESCTLPEIRCSDGTKNGECSLSKPKICFLGQLVDNPTTCGCPVGQTLFANKCIQNQIIPQVNPDDRSTSITIIENNEQYYEAFCDKIDPYDLQVRRAASEAVRPHPGEYDVNQLFDIYDWVKDNINYQNVPLGGIPYHPAETLDTQSGDCKNQAVLIASMVRAIGGNAKVVVDPSCSHAYSIVYFGESGSDTNWFTDAVEDHYGSNIEVHYFTNQDGIWMVFDPAGGNYPGNTLPACSGPRTVSYITSCRDCKAQYSDRPYQMGDTCYSRCPAGTRSANSYGCS